MGSTVCGFHDGSEDHDAWRQVMLAKKLALESVRLWDSCTLDNNHEIVPLSRP
jgi:hypothetical protein